MGTRKNHIMDALSEVHDEVEGYGADVEQHLSDADDGDSHDKGEAWEQAESVIDDFIHRLNTLKEVLAKKYK